MTWPESGRIAEVLPRNVPGYIQAQAAGQLAAVPPAPPGLVSRPSAQEMFRNVALAGFGAVLVFPVSYRIMAHFGTPPVVAFVILLLGTSLAMWGLLRMLARVGDQALREFRQGYTTLTFEFGGFWFGEGRFRLSSGLRAPWDYSALWQLDGASGAVRRAPFGTGDPPGMYPSPSRPGCWELWTGVLWLRHFEKCQ